MKTFHSIYSHGFVRACVCVPQVRVADPLYNAEQTIGLARRASENNAAVALFPELGISAYSNDDLFHQDALLDAVEYSIAQIVEASRELSPILLIGAPLQRDQKLFNCGIAIYRGQILAITRKLTCPTIASSTKKRQFTSGRNAVSRE
jgi:NAD+ synthase (glutamine-hydrolysing)